MKSTTILSALCALLTACSVWAENPPAVQPTDRTDTEESESIRAFYGPSENNYLIIYPVRGEKPAPVYLWGHANSDGKTPPSAEDISPAMVSRLNERGIAVISWESVPQVKTLQDVATCERDLETVYAWLLENSWRFGFILRFPEGKEELTGYQFEPWHYRYVGRAAARVCHENGWTLEEYHARLPAPGRC